MDASSLPKASTMVSFPVIDEKTALFIVMPVPVALLASRLLYGWIKRTGRQSERFSPAVASILTTPLLVMAWYDLAMADVFHMGIVNALIRSGVLLVVFSPIVIPLATLLAIYLLGGFRTKRSFGVLLSATSVAAVILQVCGFVYLAGYLG
jgi:hypothetical protein